MNQNEWMNNILSSIVNQAILNQQKVAAPLPEDQQAAQDKMLDAIHDLIENKKKIKPEFLPQVFDAVVLKLAAETDWMNGGRI